MKNSIIQQIIKEGKIHLVLIKCFDERKNLCHAFVVLNENELDKLKDQKNEVILGMYGTVVYSNDGHEVSDDLIDAIITGFKKHYLKGL